MTLCMSTKLFGKYEMLLALIMIIALHIHGCVICLANFKTCIFQNKNVPLLVVNIGCKLNILLSLMGKRCSKPKHPGSTMIEL